MSSRSSKQLLITFEISHIDRIPQGFMVQRTMRYFTAVFNSLLIRQFDNRGAYFGIFFSRLLQKLGLFAPLASPPSVFMIFGLGGWVDVVSAVKQIAEFKFELVSDFP